MSEKKPSKMYFDREEEEALLFYIHPDTSPVAKEVIFNEILKKAFEKMIESILRRYKLYSKEMTFKDQCVDTFSYVMTKIDRFDPGENKKAYSYFGTIIKHYGLAKVMKENKDLHRLVTYEGALPSFFENDEFVEDPYRTEVDYPRLMARVRHEIEQEIETPGLTENERKVGEALVYLFEHWQIVFEGTNNKKFNKNQLLMLLRERTLLSTKEIRNSMKRFKVVYNAIKENILKD